MNAAAVTRCPKCGSRDVRVSGRRSLLDTILTGFRLFPYRCRACRRRFRKRSTWQEYEEARRRLKTR